MRMANENGTNGICRSNWICLRKCRTSMRMKISQVSARTAVVSFTMKKCHLLWLRDRDTRQTIHRKPELWVFWFGTCHQRRFWRVWLRRCIQHFRDEVGGRRASSEIDSWRFVRCKTYESEDVNGGDSNGLGSHLFWWLDLICVESDAHLVEYSPHFCSCHCHTVRFYKNATMCTYIWSDWGSCCFKWVTTCDKSWLTWCMEQDTLISKAPSSYTVKS